MSDRETLIPKHGGYRKLKTFQIAQLIYDITVRFCDLYVDKLKIPRCKQRGIFDRKDFYQF